MSLQVDVVVGGQYGDEGKGQVALYLANLGRGYDVLARTGGENAEHRVATPEGKQHTFHVLPSGVAAEGSRDALVALAAGLTFSLAGLARELAEWPSRQVLVDRNAALVTEELRQSGLKAAELRGSTHLGVGPTVAAKVRRDGSCDTARNQRAVLKSSRFSGPAHVEVGSVVGELRQKERAVGFENDVTVLAEGSQGALLSLDHGHYPYCTSRNVTSSGVLSDLGVGPGYARRVFLVLKAVPTRVPGNSGPADGEELTWEEVCSRAGRPYEEVRQTSPDEDDAAGPEAGGVERPFDFSFEEVEYAATLCRPTSVVLTFLDWWDYACEGARTVQELTPRAKRLVAQVEEAAGCPVAWVRTGPKYHDQLFLHPR